MTAQSVTADLVTNLFIYIYIFYELGFNQNIKFMIRKMLANTPKMFQGPDPAPFLLL